MLIGAVLAVKIAVVLSAYAKSGEADGLPVYGAMLLIAESAAVLGLWIWSMHHEMTVCFDWLDPKCWVPPTALREAFLIVASALFVVVMILLADHFAAYALALTLYSAVDLYIARELRREAEDVLARCLARCNEATAEVGPLPTYRRALSLFDTFSARPHLRIRGARLALALTALPLAILDAPSWLTCALLGLAPLTVEVPLMKWRGARDRALRPLAAEVRELRA